MSGVRRDMPAHCTVQGPSPHLLPSPSYLLLSPGILQDGGEHLRSGLDTSIPSLWWQHRQVSLKPHTSLYHYPTQLYVWLGPRRRGRVDDGDVGCGPHTAPPPGPGSLPLPPEEDRTGGEGGEDPRGSDHLQPPYNILYPTSTAEIRSVSKSNLASMCQGPGQVENTGDIRNVMKWLGGLRLWLWCSINDQRYRKWFLLT